MQNFLFFLSCRKKLDRGAGWKVLGACLFVVYVRMRVVTVFLAMCRLWLEMLIKICQDEAFAGGRHVLSRPHCFAPSPFRHPSCHGLKLQEPNCTSAPSNLSLPCIAVLRLAWQASRSHFLSSVGLLLPSGVALHASLLDLLLGSPLFTCWGTGGS